jgi:hypothetical protein
MVLVDASRYSSGMPSTTSMAATPRTERVLSAPSSESIVSATCGRADRARNLGEVGAVHTMIRPPVQRNPTGITRGKPSGPA